LRSSGKPNGLVQRLVVNVVQTPSADGFRLNDVDLAGATDAGVERLLEQIASFFAEGHLPLQVTRTSQNAYGVVYEIDGPIRTPSGRSTRFCSVWQVDTGTDVPRFITMYPR